MKKSVYHFTIMIVLFCSNCTNAQNKHDSLMKTTKQLMDYMLKVDTGSIYTMFDDLDNLKNRRRHIKRDCEFFSVIINKYGFPDNDKFILSQSSNGENMLTVLLMNKVDSALNLKRCILRVFFYPDQFLDNTNKILNFAVAKELLKEPEMKLKIAPPLR